MPNAWELLQRVLTGTDVEEGKPAKTYTQEEFDKALADAKTAQEAEAARAAASEAAKAKEGEQGKTFTQEQLDAEIAKLNAGDGGQGAGAEGQGEGNEGGASPVKKAAATEPPGGGASGVGGSTGSFESRITEGKMTEKQVLEAWDSGALKTELRTLKP